MLAVHTDSRASDAQTARTIVEQAATRLKRFAPRIVYKKTDSCMRGNMGAEIDAVLDVMGFDLSFIAPAFPKMGRTTVDGVHCVNGVPVAETEMGRDPVKPVLESVVSSVVASQSLHPVAHVDIRHIEGNDDSLNKRIRELHAERIRHLTFDASEDRHLDAIARTALRMDKKILLVGSAGLADGLGRTFPKKTPAETKADSSVKGHNLLICGSASARASSQCEALAEAYPYSVVVLDPAELTDESHRKCRDETADRIARMLETEDVIVRIDGQSKGESDKIMDGLGTIAKQIFNRIRPGRLYLSGGDTARSVMTATGAVSIQLYGEIAPGVPRGRIIGGTLQGIPVVTKAGSFGTDNTLVGMHEFWRDRIVFGGMDR